MGYSAVGLPMAGGVWDPVGRGGRRGAPGAAARGFVKRVLFSCSW